MKTLPKILLLGIGHKRTTPDPPKARDRTRLPSGEPTGWRAAFPRMSWHRVTGREVSD